MEILKSKTVAETLTQNIGADTVFGKYNIDFCCGGGITLEQACKESGVTFEQLKQEIEAIKTTLSRSVNYDDFGLEDSIEYIANNFHQYFIDNVSLIGQYAAKVAQVHGASHGEVVEVNAVFMQLTNKLESNIQLETETLYPKMLAVSDKTVSNANELSIHKINITSNFKVIGGLLKELSQLTNSYTSPEGACMTYQTLYVKLKELEQKIQQYMHFEMNVLFSKI